MKTPKTAVKSQPEHLQCSICGRFLKKIPGGEPRCVKVFYDDRAGAWEHN